MTDFADRPPNGLPMRGFVPDNVHVIPMPTLASRFLFLAAACVAAIAVAAPEPSDADFLAAKAAFDRGDRAKHDSIRHLYVTGFRRVLFRSPRSAGNPEIA